jgi:hypothetical protein
MKTITLERLKEVSANRGEGFFDYVVSLGAVENEVLSIPNGALAGIANKFKPAQRWPAWAMLVAKLSAPQDLGVGDTIARTIGPVGGSAYKNWYLTTFGKTCGCTERQEQLNAKFPYL